MTKENIFKIYLRVLSTVVAVILLAAVHFIFASNYHLGGWMFFVAVIIGAAIQELELEYHMEFGHPP